MSNNIVKHDFKKNKNSHSARAKRHVRFMAILFALLMITGIIGSIIYYL